MPSGNSRLSGPVCRWFDHNGAHMADRRMAERGRAKRARKRAAGRKRKAPGAAGHTFPTFPRTVGWDGEQTAYLRKRLEASGGPAG